MFCSKCGTQLPNDGTFCPKCGNQVKARTATPAAAPAAQPAPVAPAAQPAPAAPAAQPAPTAESVYKTESNPFGIASETDLPPLENTSAALLAFFLGGLGVHDFVLGRTTQGIIKLVLTLTGSFLFIPLIPLWIWVMMDLHAIAKGTYPAVSKKLTGPTNTANTLFVVYIVLVVLGAVVSLAGLALVMLGVLAEAGSL